MLEEEHLLPTMGGIVMNFPASIKPGIWGAVIGAIAILIAGFWGLGWTTAHSADLMAQQKAETAVVAALLPFCVANAKRDTEAAKLVKFKAVDSTYSRTQFVSDAGWATMPGTTTPNDALAEACSEKLMGPKA